MSIFNSIFLFFLYVFFLGYFPLHQVASVLFQHLSLTFSSPFLSSSFISLVYCKFQFPLQTITLSVFFPSIFCKLRQVQPDLPLPQLPLQILARFLCAAPVAVRASCPALGNPETPCRVLGGEFGILQGEASPLHLLAPSPVTLLI